MSEIAHGASVEFRSIDTGFRYAAARDRVIAWLAGGFAALALLLSAVGLYGVMSHQVIRRRQEFGVRVAVGAAPGSVTALILTQAGWMIGIGLVAGLAGGLASGRLITALLFNVSPADPASIAIAAVFLAVVTVLAGLIPARRAVPPGSIRWWRCARNRFSACAAQGRTAAHTPPAQDSGANRGLPHRPALACPLL